MQSHYLVYISRSTITKLILQTGFSPANIAEDKLEEHATNRQNVFESLINLPSMYLEQWPCDILEAKCSDILDLEQHKTSYHQQDMRDPYNPYSWWPEEPY